MKTTTLPPGCDYLLTRKQLCEALGVSPRTLSAMLSSGAFPPPDLKVGERPRWRISTFNQWVKDQKPSVTACRRHDLPGQGHLFSE